MTVSEKLRIYEKVKLDSPHMLIGLSGWMDGGEVSTGTIKFLIEELKARRFAEIDSEGFYIDNFPGSMEITALFRPHARIKDGLIKSYRTSTNEFFCSEQSELILFLGKEPNLRWRQFVDCIFSLCSKLGVNTIYFIGSIAGLVPHTREPRIFCTVSDTKLKGALEPYGVKFTNYEGPASIITYLTTRCAEKALSLVSLVATVPAYVQGNNPRCIEALTKRLCGILGLQIKLDKLQDSSDEFEKRLTDVVGEQPELEETILKLEENYDNEVFDSEMGDLKKWLEQKGVRLD